MTLRNCLISSLCVLTLCIVASVSAQDKQLNDAETAGDITAYIQQEMDKHNAAGLALNERPFIIADILMPAGEKLLEIAQDDTEKQKAYDMILSGLRLQAAVKTAEPSPENRGQLASELKKWLNHPGISGAAIVSLGFDIAVRHNVPTEEFVKEWTDYIQSPKCTLSEAEKAKLISLFANLPYRLIVGVNPKLYGKTLDDKNFDWDKFRGKYVLIKFTATWCGPCQMEIPGMLEAYEKYHDSGLEIVSVYIWQSEHDPVATVKSYVEEKKLPWIIISEELSKKAGHPAYGDFYGMRSVPTMVLVDKEGKIIMTDARGVPLQAKLAEIFK